MPKALEAKLKRQAAIMGLGEKRTGAYVYGNPTMKAWRRKEKKAGTKTH